MTQEMWLPVVGWEHSYRVSDFGRVCSLTRYVPCVDGRVMLIQGILRTLVSSPKGYLSCTLANPNKTREVHVLVLTAFKGPRPPGLGTRHLDGNPANNYVSNLEYGTYRENNLDVVRHGRHKLASQTSCKWEHILRAPNLINRSNGRRGCLACNRARAVVHYAKRVGRRIDFKTTADNYYREIMCGVLV